MAQLNRIPEPPLTPEEEAKLGALRRAIDEGARELDAGLGLDGEEVFAELFRLYGKPPSEEPVRRPV